MSGSGGGSEVTTPTLKKMCRLVTELLKRLEKGEKLLNVVLNEHAGKIREK